MVRKRPFGTKRSLPSGRVQATYIGPDGLRHSAPHTFKNRKQATDYLEEVRAQIVLGQWEAEETHHAGSNYLFGHYCERHIEVRVHPKTGRGLEPSTKAHYRQLLATHLSPFAEVPISEITPALVHDWWADATKAGRFTTLSKAYKLMKATMARAVKEGLVDKNPCDVEGAQNASSGKRLHTPSKEEVELLLANLNPSYRLLCLVMASGGLRFEEATALVRADFVEVERNGARAYNVVVTKAVGWVGSDPYIKAPKSKSGERTCRLLPHLTPFIDKHMDDMSDRQPDALVFPAQKGTKSKYLQHSVLNNNFRRALGRAGLTVHFSPHALRRYFGSEYARTGANWVEIGKALGDSSFEAIKRYVHPTDRDDELSEKMRPVSFE